MKIAVWIASGVLAAAFLITGAGKLFASASDLHASAHGVPLAMLRIAGVAELLGALGLILPATTRIAPWLTPLAAAGLTVTMAAASVTVLVIGEPAGLLATVPLGIASAAVARARLGSQAIAPRSSGAARRPALSTR